MKEINRLQKNYSKVETSTEEKKVMKLKLMAYADFYAPMVLEPTASPFFVFATKHAVLSSALILSIIIAPFSYAAEQSLPGELLYPIKRNFNEGLKSAILPTPQKIEYEATRAQKRLEELATIVKEDKLTPEIVKTIEKAIVEHAESIIEKNNADNLESTNAEALLEASIETVSIMNVQIALLEEIAITTPEIKNPESIIKFEETIRSLESVTEDSILIIVTGDTTDAAGDRAEILIDNTLQDIQTKIEATDTSSEEFGKVRAEEIIKQNEDAILTSNSTDVEKRNVLKTSIEAVVEAEKDITTEVLLQGVKDIISGEADKFPDLSAPDMPKPAKDNPDNVESIEVKTNEEEIAPTKTPKEVLDLLEIIPEEEVEESITQTPSSEIKEEILSPENLLQTESGSNNSNLERNVKVEVKRGDEVIKEIDVSNEGEFIITETPEATSDNQ